LHMNKCSNRACHFGAPAHW